jgi:hypothetical protein
MASLAQQSGIADCDGLADYEKELAEELAALREDFGDEPAVAQEPYWKSVLELAAIAGALIGPTVKEGRWRVAKMEPQTLPFLYLHKDPHHPTKLIASFLVEKAMKYFEHGSAESVALLARNAAGVTNPPPPPKRGFFDRLLGK